MMDVDLFKQVNDEHGHKIGDAILRLVARTLDASCRAFDIVARWGGEEFAAIILHVDARQLVLVRRSSAPWWRPAACACPDSRLGLPFRSAPRLPRPMTLPKPWSSALIKRCTRPSAWAETACARDSNTGVHCPSLKCGSETSLSSHSSLHRQCPCPSAKGRLPRFCLPGSRCGHSHCRVEAVGRGGGR